MAKIGLTEGFTLIPEGWHVFKIVSVDYNEDYGKMAVTMQTESGQRHIERFSLLNKMGEPNEGAMNAFSFFAKTALNNYKIREIDEQDLVGHYMRCNVEHEDVPSNKGNGKMITFARLADKEPADGFDDVKIPFDDDEPAPAKPAKKQGSFDLDSLLG